MARQTVNIGSAPNDGTGDPLRVAYDKLNDNFLEIYDEGGANIIVNNPVTLTETTLDVALADIEAGSGGGAVTSVNSDTGAVIVDLQSVTDEGNTTSNPIIFNDGSDEFEVSGTSIKYKAIGSGFIKELTFDSLSANRNLILPNSDGTLVVQSDLENYIFTEPKTADFDAVNSALYTANGTITVTDPTPVTNKGYIVHVIGGTSTIGGVGYTTGDLVYRYYDGTSWISTNMNASTLQDLQSVLTEGNIATDSTIELYNTINDLSNFINSQEIAIENSSTNDYSYLNINALSLRNEALASTISVQHDKVIKIKGDFSTSLTFTDPTANRVITFKDESGTVALTSDIPSPITIDATPTDGSSNAVSSNGVFDALDLKAPLASPALTGNPTAPTQSANENSTKLATTAYIENANLQRKELVLTGKTIVFFGDSYTTGFGATNTGRRYSSLLTAAVGGFELNQGVQGTTMEKRVPINYINSPNMVDNVTTIPTYVSTTHGMLVFQFGLNDIGQNGANYTPANYITDAQTVLTYANVTKGWPMNKILMLGAPYANATGYAAYATLSGNPAPDVTRHLAFIEAQRQVAQTNQTMFLDWYALQVKNDILNTMNADGYHPNDLGHYSLAKYTANYLGYGGIFESRVPVSSGTNFKVVNGGGSFSNVEGSQARTKVDVYNDGANVFGFSTSTNRGEYHIYTGGSHTFYIGGASRLNLSASGLGIINGITAPTAKVHIGAGTASAGTAPLKLTSGTNLTTPENGAVEYNGTNFFITTGGVRYQIDRQVLAGSYSTTATAQTTFTVTIGSTMANTNYKVNVTPSGVLTAAVFYVSNKTTTTFDVTYLSALTGAVSFDWIVAP